MNLDPDISNWILDFYLRQPLDDRRLNSLLRAFPPPSDSANLHKLLLLKRLEFDVSLRRVSEIALESIERLEDLEFRRGNRTVSDAMKWAYCAAAVESTLKCVKEGHDGGDEYSFFETVKRIWRLRVGRLKKTALEVGLRSDLLWGWKDTMETAVWDDNLRRDVVEKFQTAIAVDAVELYLKEERQRMGTSFLEEFAEAMKHDEGLSKLMGVLQDQAASGSNPNKELQKRIDKFRGKRVVRMLSNSSRGVKIVDLDETDRGPSCRNDSLPLIAEVNRARDFDETAEGPSCRNGSLPLIAEGNRARDLDEKAEGPSCRNDSLPGSAEVNRARDFNETAEGPSCRNGSLPLIAEVNRARDFDETAEGPSCRNGRLPLIAEVNRARDFDETAEGPSCRNGSLPLIAEVNRARDFDETAEGPSCRNGRLPLIAEVNRARDFDETAEGPSCRNGSLPLIAEVNRARDFDKTAEGPSCRNDSSPRIAEVNRARDFNEMAEGPSCRTDRSPLSAEVNRAREALKLSSLELRAAVIDPLPEALRAAEAISDAIRQEELNIPSEGNAGRSESLLVDAAGVAHSIGGDVKNAPKPSLMDRNSSARTYEWDDSIDESQEDLARRTKRRLPSPTRLNTSPLRIYEANNVKRRRKGRRWSSAEEDALRTGVATYGKGNWKVILNTNRDAFEGRTEVDLKDKWRNLTRLS